MKLRMRDNSVRLRLLRDEVDALARGQRIVETVAFGPSPAPHFAYAINSESVSDAVRATFDGGCIEVFVPAVLVRQWANSEQVGIECRQPCAQGQSLEILIEKDFACLQPRDGDEDNDTFANPKRTIAS